ncbi:hypothetical protein [Chryseobacterium oryctis]|uniref:Aspartyl protease n=1 Tax=Chryseobacterium oryctis TaxID=2952618 RepID=A0ABT3HSR6_9FLAO|nr:hypothetical protein [Chryseobacterium oryctis]MCW3162832.1 hypothetical protein [Chryseobacterium oryctis]
MKIFKKILLGLLITFTITIVGGYIYFNKKFTPPENNLTISGTSENIPLRWISNADNPYSALLLPVQIKGVDKTFYMQLDTGSPTTIFYSKSLESIQNIFFPKNNIKDILSNFKIGKMEITSQNFKTLDYGKPLDLKSQDAKNIIGTIGTDLLEKRVIILNFKENTCSFLNEIKENGFHNFEFKKRKILLPARIGNENLKLMYDSGTSGYELITHKETWAKYRIPKANLKIEKGNSWGKTLTIKSSPSNQTILFGDKKLKLNEITYIEGTSKIQNFLMKSSGMTGMLGNKIFLNHVITLDCKNEKFKIE